MTAQAGLGGRQGHPRIHSNKRRESKWGGREERERRREDPKGKRRESRQESKDGLRLINFKALSGI